MSKQVKLKFKKLLKKAEFVHADLEYHEELIGDAKNMFSQEIANTIKGLGPELQQKIREREEEMRAEQEQKIQAAAEAADKREDSEPEEAEEGPSETALAESEHEAEEAEIPKDTPEDKAAQIKKLYRQIAALTHPDKAQASGVSGREAQRLERIFIQAKQAYDKSNWYILYSLALSLDLEVDEPTEEQLVWLEEDIRQTMASISMFGNMLAWMWFNGNEQIKQTALNNFFEQVYGISLGPITLTPEMLGSTSIVS